MTDQTPIVAAAIRHDGWTPARRTQFLDCLANDGSISAACARVNMSREAAYRLRRRDALFARAWNAALVLAREASAEVLECRAIHGVEEQIWFRGELVGARRRYDSRLLLAHIARLDKIAEDECAGDDAARFDELLALIGGETPPSELMADEDALPLPRGEAIEVARVAAVDEWQGSPSRERVGDCYEAADRAAVETAATWDKWRYRSVDSVDRLLEKPRQADACTPSELSTSPAAGIDQAKALDAVDGVTPVSPSPAETPALLTGYGAWKAREGIE